MIKKMMLLAMAVAAFAIPASASASGEFLDDGEPAGHIHETFSGWFAFDTAIGGIKCNVHPTVTFDSSGGTVTTLGITTSTCVGSGAPAKCTLIGDALHGAPTVTPTSSNVDVSGVVLTHVYGGPECPLLGATLTFPSLTLTPNNSDSISSYTISGQGSLAPLGLTAVATGELEVENPDTISLT